MSALAEQTRWLNATEQAALVADGELEPAALVDAAIERIERLDPPLAAITLRYFEQAREAATSLPDGPLTGVPFLIKEVFTDVAGQVCAQGNVALKASARPAEADGPLVARFRAAGLVLLARTSTSEFGSLPAAESRAWGATRNPWDTTRHTGGSSGGSAAAVAAGMVPAAHGNDAAGSIRIPASCCGLVGLKPGRVDPARVDSLWDFTTELALTRSVRDTALLLDVACGATGAPGLRFRREVGVHPGRLRVGVTDTRFDGSPVHADCADAARSVGRLLESLGHHVEPGAPAGLVDPTLERLFGAFFTAAMADVLDDVAAQLGRDLTEDDVEPLNRALGALGARVDAAERRAVLDVVPGFARAVASWWDDHDLLLTPTLAEPPLAVGELFVDRGDPLASLLRAQRYAPFTPFVNIVGLPAISLPLHVSPTGLPIGVHLVAGPGREDVLLRVAAQLETAAPWHDRHPAP